MWGGGGSSNIKIVIQPEPTFVMLELHWIRGGVGVRLSTFLDLPIENIGLHSNLTFVAFGINIKHTALVLASDSWK
jgi:hypothetical protein